MSSPRQTWIRRARLAAVLLLLACASGLEALPPVQALPLAVLFTPEAGTFVASETVALSVPGAADIRYTLDGSLPTALG